jgi:hypothetical protein
MCFARKRERERGKRKKEREREDLCEETSGHGHGFDFDILAVYVHVGRLVPLVRTSVTVQPKALVQIIGYGGNFSVLHCRKRVSAARKEGLGRLHRGVVGNTSNVV